MALRTSVVTGASAGIGREIVRQLVVERGMTVLATARRLDRLEALAGELPAGRVLVEAGDLADPGFRDRLWARATAEFPEGVDLLVNNAGFGQYDDYLEQDAEVIRRIFGINVLALMDLTQKAARHMKERGGGQILEISSVLGFVGLPYSTAYAASKHAVNGFVKSLRYELRGTGVRVWAACPNRVVSEFHQTALGDGGPGAAKRAAFAREVEPAVRAILKGLESRKGFWLPGLNPWGVVTASRLFPGLFDVFMGRWAPAHFRREMEEARGEVSPRGSSPP